VKDGELIEARDAARHLNGSAMPGIVTEFTKAVVGKRVKHVGYVLMDRQCWPCLVFEDGTNIIAQCDDEANGPGVLSYSDKGQPVQLLCETQFKP